MNSVKIEKNSIYFLKQVICNHELMNDYINDNDKEPSWDGYIYLYNSSELKAEDISYKIPVQVKGKNKEELLKRKSITYPVEYKHLRNYYRDGGVFYFVIIVSDDGKNKAIFYNGLTPIKLQRELKGTESKKADQTKSIGLIRLEKDDCENLYKILLQFGHDSKQQGSGEGELVRKAINKDDIEEIDSLRATIVDNYQNITPDEIVRKITSGEICLYGHRKNSDTWYPFSYEEQTQMRMVTCIEVKKSFGIDDEVFYNKFYKKNDGIKEFYQLSDNVTIDISSGSVNFKPVSGLKDLKKDIRFLRNIPLGNSYCINGKKAIIYENSNMPSELQNDLDIFELIINAFEKFNISCEKRIEEFTEENWKSINNLINLYLCKIKPKEETAWYMWWWEDEVYPILLTKDTNGKIEAYNITIDKNIRMYATENHYVIPNCCMYKRDIWEKLFAFDIEILLDELEECDFNETTGGEFSQIMIEILAAYDTTKNQKYYDIAKYISDKLCELNPNNQYWIINRLQIQKRKRDLTEKEIKELEEIEGNPTDDLVNCAVDILLENKHSARKKIEKLSDENRDVFEKYPIYNLLK